jgi:predicted transcriptional regulator
MDENKTHTIIIRVSADLKAKLQKMADMDSRKLSDFIRLQLTKLAEGMKKAK